MLYVRIVNADKRKIHNTCHSYILTHIRLMFTIHFEYFIKSIRLQGNRWIRLKQQHIGLSDLFIFYKMGQNMTLIHIYFGYQSFRF